MRNLPENEPTRNYDSFCVTWNCLMVMVSSNKRRSFTEIVKNVHFIWRPNLKGWRKRGQHFTNIWPTCWLTMFSPLAPPSPKFRQQCTITLYFDVKCWKMKEIRQIDVKRAMLGECWRVVGQQFQMSLTLQVKWSINRVKKICTHLKSVRIYPGWR